MLHAWKIIFDKLLTVFVCLVIAENIVNQVSLVLNLINCCIQIVFIKKKNTRNFQVVDMCQMNNLCWNNGTCISDTRYPGIFMCECMVGYAGDNCEKSMIIM